MVLRFFILIFIAVYGFAVTISPTTFDLRSLSILISNTCNKNILVSKDLKNLSAGYFFSRDVPCSVLFSSYARLIKSKNLTLSHFSDYYIVSKNPFPKVKELVIPDYKNIEISLKVFEINNDKFNEKGFKSLINSTFSSSSSLIDFKHFSFSNLFDLKFSGVLSALENNGYINVLSQPRVIVTNGKTSVMNVGDTVSVLTSSVSNDKNANGSVRNTYQQKNVGLTIRVTPHFIPKTDLISLNVSLNLETLKSYDKGFLTTSKRSLNSNFNIKYNGSAVLGGLIQTQDLKSLIKVPILGNLPILKYLFSYHSDKKIKKTLSVFIKVKVLK